MKFHIITVSPDGVNEDLRKKLPEVNWLKSTDGSYYGEIEITNLDTLIDLQNKIVTATIFSILDGEAELEIYDAWME